MNQVARSVQPLPTLFDLVPDKGSACTETWWGLLIGSDELSGDNINGNFAISLVEDEVAQESDVRLKCDITQVGRTVYGLPLYRFRYIGRDEFYEGVMAQDVLGVMPSAVTRAASGTYLVNYQALGIEMRQVA